MPCATIIAAAVAQNKRPWLAPGPPQRTGRLPGIRPEPYLDQWRMIFYENRDPRSVIMLGRLLNRLAVQGEIEAFALHLSLHAQADQDVDDLQDDERHHEVVDEHDADADALVDDLRGVALDQAGRAAVRLD